jgi:hypothetical protein
MASPFSISGQYVEAHGRAPENFDVSAAARVWRWNFNRKSATTLRNNNNNEDR